MPKTEKDQDYSVDHCIQRMKERYDVDITKKDYDQLNDQVKKFMKTYKNKNDTDKQLTIIGIEKQKSATLYVLKVESFKGKTVFINYEDVRDCVTTILPPITKIR